MSYYLLFSDVHLDEKPENEYRWNVFEHVFTAVRQYNVDTVFCLGDLVDRKDRFSAAFVNRLLTNLYSIAAHSPIVILRGNHDTTLQGPNYFEILNTFAKAEGAGRSVQYITKPTEIWDGLLLLPYSSNPKEEWKDIRLASYKAVFMHATVSGARFENGQIVEKTSFPELPSRVKFYSGDVHVPQQVRNITYVGAPHPTKFGDDYPSRMLLLDENYDVSLEIPLTTLRKAVIEVKTLDDLDKIEVRSGDQVRIVCNLTVDQLGQAGIDENKVYEWACSKGVTVDAIETNIEGEYESEGLDLSADDEEVLRQYAQKEGLTDRMVEVGLEILKRI